MRVEPFSVDLATRFRGTEVRSGLLLEGAEGWGEWSPFPEYRPRVAARWLAAAVEAATLPWPAPLRDRVPVNTTVPAVGPDRAYAMVRRSGCRVAKVKVAEPGQGAAADLDRVAAVRDALGPGGAIRVDANGAWTVDEAGLAIHDLDHAAKGLEYVEQPVADVADFALLKHRTDVPLAADEALRLAEDPLAVDLSAVDVVVVKVQPLGGVWRALEVAEACGRPVVVSSALETSVGLAMGVALAAALPELPYACGLGTATLLDDDVVADPMTPVDGHLEVRRPVVDPARLARCEPDPETAARLVERYHAARRATAPAPSRTRSR